MTQLVEKAFAAIARLPEAEQDAIAAIILEELASEERWQAALGASPDALGKLADEALAEYRAGKTQPLDPDAL
jgi:hypothetical protein